MYYSDRARGFTEFLALQAGNRKVKPTGDAQTYSRT